VAQDGSKQKYQTVLGETQGPTTDQCLLIDKGAP